MVDTLIPSTDTVPEQHLHTLFCLLAQRDENEAKFSPTWEHLRGWCLLLCLKIKEADSVKQLILSERR